MDEIDDGTVDFCPTTTARTEEPRQLPARLPFTLLNGASGIVVGLATETLSHNLREIADARVALIVFVDWTTSCTRSRPGLTIRAEARSSPASEIAAAYTTGRGFAQGARLLEDRGSAASGNWWCGAAARCQQHAAEEIEDPPTEDVAGKKRARPGSAQTRRATGGTSPAGRRGAPGLEPKTSRPASRS
jgi:topoisomerase-4 subunit A